MINIITFDPKYDNVNTVEVHGGTQDDLGGSVVQTLHLGGLISARLSAGGERQQEWANSLDFVVPWRAHTMGDVLVRLGPDTDLRLQGSWSRSWQTEINPTATYGPALTTTYSIDGALTSATPYGEIEARIYLNDLRYGGDIAYGGNIRFDFSNQTTVASLQDLFKVGTRSTVRVALEERENSINTQPISGGHIGNGIWAPSVMWTIAATGKLSLTAAARLDALQMRRTGPIADGLPFINSDWNRSTNSFSVNLGANYVLNDLDTLRAAYARGIEPASLVNLGGLQGTFGPTPFGLALSGNPRLRPAVVSNYEVSYDRVLPKLGARFSAKLFFQQTDDVQGKADVSSPSLAPTATSDATALPSNISRSKMVGFELSGSGKINGGFHWSADTTYTNLADTPIGVTSADLVNLEVAFSHTTPKFRGNVAAGWNDDHWALDAYLHYVSRFDTYAPLSVTSVVLATTPGYLSLSARVGYQISDGLIVALSAQNLGSQRQAQGAVAGLQAPRRVVFSLTKSW